MKVQTLILSLLLVSFIHSKSFAEKQNCKELLPQGAINFYETIQYDPELSLFRISYYNQPNYRSNIRSGMSDLTVYLYSDNQWYDGYAYINLSPSQLSKKDFLLTYKNSVQRISIQRHIRCN